MCKYYSEIRIQNARVWNESGELCPPHTCHQVRAIAKLFSEKGIRLLFTLRVINGKRGDFPSRTHFNRCRARYAPVNSAHEGHRNNDLVIPSSHCQGDSKCIPFLSLSFCWLRTHCQPLKKLRPTWPFGGIERCHCIRTNYNFWFISRKAHKFQQSVQVHTQYTRIADTFELICDRPDGTVYGHPKTSRCHHAFGRHFGSVSVSTELTDSIASI